MGNYLEKNDEKFAIQFANFGSKIDLYKTTFGLTDEEVASIQKDATFNEWAVTNFKKVETYKRNWTSFKNILRNRHKQLVCLQTPMKIAIHIHHKTNNIYI